MQQSTSKPVSFAVIYGRSTVRGYEFRQGLEQFAHALCADFKLGGISVEWTPGIQTAAISKHGNIMLSAVRDDAVITNALLRKYAGFIVHELLHRKYTDFSVNPEFHDPHFAYKFKLLNGVEDARIERAGIRDNLTGNIRGLLVDLINGMVSESISRVSDWSDPAQYPFALAVYCREFCKRVPVPAELVPVFEQASRRLDTAKNSADAWSIAQWVFDQLKTLPKQSENQKPQQAKQPGQSEQSENAEQGQADQPGQDASQNASEPSTTDDHGEGEGEGAGEGENAPGAPADAGSASAPNSGQEAMEVEPQCEAPDNVAAGGRGSYSSRQIRESNDAHLGDHRYRVNVTVPGKLRYEIRRMFDNSATTLFNPGKKFGSIDPRALHRVDTTDRVFQQRRDIDGIDSAVVICLDISGSMFDDRFIKPALDTCAALIESLQSAEVATAVVTFGSSVSLSVPFNTRGKMVRDRLSRVSNNGSTNDYVAIKYAHDLLRMRRETRKICFVITDGCGYVEAAREQAASGDAFGITTIGIGICMNVAHVYPRAIRVNSVDDLGTVSFGQIKTVI